MQGLAVQVLQLRIWLGVSVEACAFLKHFMLFLTES